MRYAFVLISMLLSTVASAAEAGDTSTASEVAALADRVIAAYGGAEAIERSGYVVQTGTLETVGSEEAGTIKRTLSRPDKLLIEIDMPDGRSESRLIIGERGWRGGVEVNSMLAKSMSLQMVRLDLPYRIMTAGDELTTAGPPDDDVDDPRTLRTLEIPLPEGLRMIAIVDAETGLIIRSHGLVMSTSPHGSRAIEFSTIYSGHKDMGGVIVATEEVQSVQGHPTGRTVLEQVEILDAAPDGANEPGSEPGTESNPH